MKLIRLDSDEKYLDRISVSEIFHKEDIVGVNSLELRTPATVEEGQRLLLKDQLGNWQEFIIQDFDEIHKGSLTRLVYAEHSISELWTDYLVDKRPSGTASNALLVALEPTRWKVGTVNDFGLSSASFYNISVFEALSIIAKKWNCEIQPRIQVTGNKVTGRYIDLIIRGRTLGERFRYGKDMDFVRRTVSRRNLVTALYGYGKGEEMDTGGFGRRVNFAAINGGKAYLENNTARLIYGRNNDDGTKSHLFGKVLFDEEEDPAVVKSLTQAELDKRSVVEVTYEFNVKDLTNRGREFERISIGDTIHARDDELNLDILARVTSIRRNLLYSTDREVTLGSYRTLADSLILDRNALDRLKGKEGVWDKVAEQIESGDGSYLTNLIDLLNEKMNLQGGYVYISDTGDGWITYDKPIDENPTSAIQIVGGGFRIANNKLPNGDWNWRTFGTGDGFVADELVAGILRGGKVQWNLEDGTFLIGNSIDDYNLYFDGTNLFIKGDNIDLSTNESITIKVQSETQSYIDANKEQLKGADGNTPVIQNGFWYINGTSTGIKAEGQDGAKGADGIDGATPEIIDGTWWVDGLDTGVQADVAPIREEFESYRTQTDKAIADRVTKTEYSGLTTRVEQAEQKLTPTSITQTVENNTTTLAKKSEVKLVDDAWKAEFSSMSIGGTNLLHDSNFESSYSKKMWEGNQNVTLNWGSSYLAVTLNQDISTPGILSTNNLSLTPGTYTISGDIATGKAIIFYASDGVTDIRQTLQRNSYIGDDIISSTTFTISTKLVNARYGFLSTSPSVGDVIYFGKVKLEKGSKRTDWSPHPDELYAGITTIDKDGVTVGREGETIETNLGFDGVRISDGATEIASFTGSGAVIKSLEAESISGDVINTMSSSMTFNIGSGTGYYGDFAEVKNAIGNRKHLDYGVKLTINIQSVLNEGILIEGFSGGGSIELNIYSRVNGYIRTSSNSCAVRVYGRNTTHVLIASGQAIVSSADAFVYLNGLNIDSKNTTSGIGITSQDGSNVYVQNCDIINVRDALYTQTAGKLQAVNTKGNVTRYAALGWGGSIWLRGTIPDGDTYSFVYEHGTLTRTPSSFSPPATQTVTETRTFNHTDIYTYSVKYGARSTYYGKAAAQNRWDTSMTFMKGRIVFGSSVYSFISGRNSGTSPTVKIRLRRQNSSHGSSSSVKPTPEWSGAPSFGGATRGNWTPWVTIPYSLFTSSGYTFSFYNGTMGSSYAIWDRAEIQITRTVTQ